MKKTVKKLLCLILSISVLFTVQLSAAAAEVLPEGENNISGVKDIPVVYIGGQNEIIYSDKTDIDSELIFTDTLSAEAISDLIKDSAPTLSSAMRTNNWTPFCDAVFNSILPHISPIALDENGNATGNAGYDCLKQEASFDKAVNGCYGLYDYEFNYDWRIDPCTNAIELDLYIKSVLAVTGAQKVNILVSGIGYSTLLAYIYAFGSDSINSIMLYGVGIEGIELSGVLLSGNIQFDSVLLNRYIQQTPSGKDPILSLAKFGADFLIGNGFSESVLNLTSKIYMQIYSDIIPRILMESYATMPGFWSTVSDEYYETAKAFIFNSEGNETVINADKDYSLLTEKIDFFHNNILVRAKNILNGAKANGVNIYNVAKYGFCALPLFPNAQISSDGYITLKDSTPGAKVAPYGEKLSEEYLSQARISGSILYISPDSEIDSSTGYLPARTWYIKNLGNKERPAVVDIMLEKILNREDDTSVFSMEEYPQYMVCNQDGTRMEPLTETGVITPTLEEEFEDFVSFDSPTKMLEKVIKLIGRIILFFKNIIGRIIPD